MSSMTSHSSPLEGGAGIYFKQKHFQEIMKSLPSVGWFEVHSENYMSPGGLSRKQLELLREKYPISLHGVSLSLGSADSLSQSHLKGLKELIDWIDPVLVSEHLSWSRFGGTYLNDLLPVPYTLETLAVLCEHIDQSQDILQRQILIENPSTYITFKDSTFTETEFLSQALKRTGCKLLLDVNNLYVSCMNHNWNPQKYIQSIPIECVGEIHLAGHAERKVGDQVLRIDDHGSRVCEAVWQLYEMAIERFGAIPTMVEWDTDVPTLETLLNEAWSANKILECQRQEKENDNVLTG